MIVPFYFSFLLFKKSYIRKLQISFGYKLFIIF